ncbi:hypothetical protein ISCGN_009773 [Ixodes scapularis]
MGYIFLNLILNTSGNRNRNFGSARQHWPRVAKYMAITWYEMSRDPRPNDGRDWGGRVAGASVVCTALFATFWCLRHSTTSAQLRHKSAHVVSIVWTKLRETIITIGETTTAVVTRKSAGPRRAAGRLPRNALRRRVSPITWTPLSAERQRC